MVLDLPHSNKKNQEIFSPRLIKASDTALTTISLVKFLAFSRWKPKTHVLLHIFPSKPLILGKERVIDVAWEIKEEMYSKIMKNPC